jgi:UDP-2,4-diacetamido-2,4,6-trideoxy-beta-L-altropyranose hydrolase
VFRADASVEIGMGHIMRCLTLADELRRVGHRCLFLCYASLGQEARLIRNQGHAVTFLPQSAAAPGWQSDAEESREALKTTEEPVDWLVVDHYGLDANWEISMREHVRRIMVIDDMADRAHACDLLLDQNLLPEVADRYGPLLPSYAAQLLGPKFALLRPEFAAARQKNSSPRNGVVREILVSFGGTDSANATTLAVQALIDTGITGITVHVVMGSSAPYADEVADLCFALPWVQFYRPADDMAGLMACSDLALGAAGSTVWERCAVGLPALLISLAPNQIPIARGVAQAGAARYLGPIEEIDTERIGSALQSVLQAPAALQEMSRSAWNLTDGGGTKRVAEEMMRLS